jgi:hypothetical protein
MLLNHLECCQAILNTTKPPRTLLSLLASCPFAPAILPQASLLILLRECSKYVYRLLPQASLVILLRTNHVAHAISSFRHFNKPRPPPPGRPPAPAPPPGKGGELLVPWNAQQLRQSVEDLRQTYAR